MEKIKNYLVLIYLFLGFFAVLPFFHSGFILVHDNTQVARVLEMAKSLGDGMSPVRFVPDLGYGFGYPIFNFYAPLPYYIGGILSLIGFGPLLSTNIAFIFATLLAGLSMFFLAKEVFGKEAGLVSSIIYLYFPYHALDIFVRGDLGEAFAYAFLPLVFLGFIKIFQKVEKGKITTIFPWGMFTIFSFTFVILSHNLSAFMSLFFIIPFLVAQFFLSKNKTLFISINFLVLILVFLLSAFYTVPAIFEMKYTNIFSQVGGGAAYFDHFVCPIQLWDSPWGFGGSAKGCLDGISFRLGKVNIILAGVSILLFFFSKKKHFFVFFAFLLFLFSIFMTTSYSGFIWKLPYMDFLQYPWRFLIFSGLFLSLIVGYLVSFLINLKQKYSCLILVFVITLTLLNNLKLFSPNGYEYVNYNDSKYLKWTVSKISDEYLPQNFKKPKFEKEVRNSTFDVVKGIGSVRNLTEKTNYLKTEINLSSNSLVRANKAYFPGWQLYVNGKKESFEVSNDGLYFRLEKGKNLLVLKYFSTSIQQLANLLSLTGLGAIVVGIIIYSKKNEKTS